MKSGALKSIGLTWTILASMPQLAMAQGDVDELVVTATKRAQSIQDVPFTVQALPEQVLQDVGAFDFSGIVDEFAGVEFRTTQPGQGAISVRGIAELNTANINGGTGTAVGLYVDEAPLSVAGLIPQVVLFDLERLEVLKGPQGTLFGEGSLAGTVRLITNKPDTEKFDAKFDGTYSSIKDGGSNYLGNVMVNIPIVEDRIAIRGVGFYYDQGGYIDRIEPEVSIGFPAPGVNSAIPFLPNVDSTFTTVGVEEDANDSETYGGRAQLLWNITDSLTATASVLIIDADRGTRNQGTLDRVSTISTGFEGADDKLRQYNLVLEQDFDFGSFLSSTTYFDREITYTTDQIGIIDVANDFAFALSAIVVGVPEFFNAVRANFQVDTEDLTQEVRFVSDFDGPFQITGGVFYRKRDFTFDFTTPTEPAGSAALWNAAVGFPLFTMAGEGDVMINSASETRQVAGFGEATYDVTERLRLLFGGRIFNEKRESSSTAFGVFIGAVPASTFATDANETIFNPRASISYDVSDDVASYFTYSKGFRSGGQNDLNAFIPLLDLESYDSERLTTFEAGIKSRLFNDVLTFNISGFLNKWQDLQVVLAEGPGGAGELIGNAGDARSYGVDIEAVLEPIEGLTLSASATLIETDIRDTVLTVPNPAGPGFPDIPVPVGTDIPNTAETQISASATYRRPITDDYTGLLRVGISHIGDSLSSLTSLTGATPQPSTTPGYTVVDLRAGIEAEHWALNFFVDNLFDEKIIYGTRAGSVARDFTTGDLAFIQGPPRTIGVNLRLNM